MNYGITQERVLLSLYKLRKWLVAIILLSMMVFVLKYVIDVRNTMNIEVSPKKPKIDDKDNRIASMQQSIEITERHKMAFENYFQNSIMAKFDYLNQPTYIIKVPLNLNTPDSSYEKDFQIDLYKDDEFYDSVRIILGYDLGDTYISELVDCTYSPLKGIATFSVTYSDEETGKIICHLVKDFTLEKLNRYLIEDLSQPQIIAESFINVENINFSAKQNQYLKQLNDLEDNYFSLSNKIEENKTDEDKSDTVVSNQNISIKKIIFSLMLGTFLGLAISIVIVMARVIYYSKYVTIQDLTNIYKTDFVALLNVKNVPKFYFSNYLTFSDSESLISSLVKLFGSDKISLIANGKMLNELKEMVGGNVSLLECQFDGNTSINDSYKTENNIVLFVPHEEITHRAIEATLFNMKVYNKSPDFVVVYQ